MSEEEDFLTGTETVARAFQKYLRGKTVTLKWDKCEASMLIGNYKINFHVRQLYSDEINLEVKDVADAR